MRRGGQSRTRYVLNLGLPPQLENREEPLRETEPIARLTVDQFMDRFEVFVVNIARREVEVRTCSQNTIEHARDLGTITFESKGLGENIRTIVIGTECTNLGTLVRVAMIIERSHREAQRVAVVSFEGREVSKEEDIHFPEGPSLMQKRLVVVDRGANQADHIPRHVYLL
ncbi:hypothetical protein WN943_025809 [Citrus x changshan-huyou]